jgi:hypothetical protein
MDGESRLKKNPAQAGFFISSRETPVLSGDCCVLTFATVCFEPLSRRERGWGEGPVKSRWIGACAASPYPHPALRATFSRWEKGSNRAVPPSGTPTVDFRRRQAVVRAPRHVHERAAPLRLSALPASHDEEPAVVVKVSHREEPAVGAEAFFNRGLRRSSFHHECRTKKNPAITGFFCAQIAQTSMYSAPMRLMPKSPISPGDTTAPPPPTTLGPGRSR